MNGLKSWLGVWSLLVVVSLFTGCSTQPGRLLVDKSEITPVKKLKVDFLQTTPEGVSPSSGASLFRSLDEAGYYNGELGAKYLAAIAGGFRDCGIEAVNGRIYKQAIYAGEAGKFSHLLVIVPSKFQYHYKTNLASIYAEMRLYDLGRKKIVWQSTVSVPVFDKKDAIFPVKELPISFADETLISLDEIGFIKLDEETKEKLKQRIKVLRKKVWGF